MVSIAERARDSVSNYQLENDSGHQFSATKMNVVGKQLSFENNYSNQGNQS